MKEDGHISTPEALSTFKLALSLRSSAPRVEAHYHFYENSIESNPQNDKASDCENWVLFEGRKYCSPDFKKSLEFSSTTESSTLELPFDRATGDGPLAILYADIESPQFAAFHQVLAKDANEGKKTYRYRYRPNEARRQETSPVLPVSGYGVELALKRTDYIVIDDREAAQDSKQQPLSQNVELDEEDEVADLKPLSQTELALLGAKAASYILENDNPLDALVKLSQDFPKFSSSIAAYEVSKSFEDERSETFGAEVRDGVNALWVNGLQLIERQIQPHGLVDILRRERKLIDGVRSLGFTGKEAVSLLGHQQVSDVKADSSQLPDRYDWTDRSEDGKVILWLNDLEKDELYEDYPKSLMGVSEFLRLD